MFTQFTPRVLAGFRLWPVGWILCPSAPSPQVTSIPPGKPCKLQPPRVNTASHFQVLMSQHALRPEFWTNAAAEGLYRASQVEQ